MATTVVLYEYDDNTAKRDELRPAHRDFLASRDGLLVSGPTGPGADGTTGAVIVYDADSPAELEAWLDGDPFWTAGTISRRVVTPWMVGMGSWKDSLGL